MTFHFFPLLLGAIYSFSSDLSESVLLNSELLSGYFFDTFDGLWSDTL